MHPDLQTTLADLAVRKPAASRVFKRHRLDFCCGGRRALAEACVARGLDPEAVWGEIEREAAPTSTPPLDDANALIDFILERYHEPLRRELPELVALAKRVERAHGQKPDCPHGLAEMLETMQSEVLSHLEKEEWVLFPMLRAHVGNTARGPIAVMQREHDDHGASLARMRELTADLTAPAYACTTWRALYLRLAELESELMDHIHLENNVLFPQALTGDRREA